MKKNTENWYHFHLKENQVEQPKIEEPSQSESLPGDFRRINDTLAKAYYIVCWIYIGAMYLFSTNSTILNLNDRYFAFDILTIIYLMVDYRLNIMHQKESFPMDSHRLAHYGEDTLKAVLTCFLIFGGLIVIWEWIIYPLIPIVPASGTNDLILYQLTRSIPLEEYFFRGLIMLSIVTLLNFFFLKKGENELSHKRKEAIIWWVAIIISAIMFGFYHLPKYLAYESYPFIPIVNSEDAIIGYMWVGFSIIYLVLLGLVLGYTRYRFGLLYALLIHMANNILASLAFMAIIILLT
jgi:membrane protease YdiL (CAAX protease family)